MGKKSRRQRKRQKKTRTKALARRARNGTARVRFEISELELAKGHDGLMRGAPEPLLLVGVYRIDDDAVALHGRFLYRFAPPGPFPAKVAPLQNTGESIVVPRSPTTRFAVLVLALEEDSGRGVQGLYAALEQTESIVVWPKERSSTMPIPLTELGSTLTPVDTALSVELMFGDRDPSVALQGDDWIGASLFWTDADRGTVHHRLRFVANDARNDWTAVARLSVGSA